VRRFARALVSHLVGSSILVLPWVAGSGISFAVAETLLHGRAAIALSALLAPPLALGFTYGLRGALRRVLGRYETQIGEALARREGEALMRDPEFLESLAQMARGEHRPWNEIKEELGE
jgi:hypothetical protein